MCPKYALPIDEVMVEEAVEKNVEKTTYALIDWKKKEGKFLQYEEY
jgi:hypothetical protein